MIIRLVKLSISIIFYISYRIVVFFIKVVKKKFPATLVIITYHCVKMEQRSQFEKQMDILLQLGHPIHVNGALPTSHNNHYIGVTFDDGYQSVLENALPILQTRKIPATIFVTTGALGKKPEWIGNPDHIYANERVLTEKQLKELPDDLITIGSHTVSHVHLTDVDESTARREIVDSKETLEKLLNKKITLFAAPYAIVHKDMTTLFEEAGYERVFLNIPTYPTTKTDLYIMGRTSVEATDWPLEFRLKLLGAYQWLPLAISLRKKLRGQS